jgi:hypothetical protein
MVESGMANFRLRDRVRRIGHDETRTIEEIREGAGEPMYSIQLGLDFATRLWARESELENAPDFIRPDHVSSGMPARPSKGPNTKRVGKKVGKKPAGKTGITRNAYKVSTRKASRKKPPRKRG